MSQRVYELLEKMDRYTDSPYVFTNPERRDRYTRFHNTLWRKAVKDSGIRHLRWHDLRHTFGSRLAQAGVPLNTISELMGHTSIVVTNRYAHQAPDNRRDAVGRLDLARRQAEKKARITEHGAEHSPVYAAQ